MELTPEELELLTPEEIRGLQEPEDGSGNNDGADAGDKDDQNADTDLGTGAAADEQAAADAAAAAATAETATDEAAEASAAKRFQPGDVPLIRPGQTDDADARIAQLEGELEAIGEKHDNGEITSVEMTRQQRAINKQLNRIELEQFRTDLSQDTAQAQSEAAWNASVGSFLGAHPELGTSDLRLRAYDYELRKVTGDEANIGKSDAEMLELARQNWARELGVDLKPATQAPKADKPGDKPPVKSATDRPDTPSLSGLPSSEAQSTDDGRFANLDRLMQADPLAFEAELARLSPQVRDEYLKFGG